MYGLMISAKESSSDGPDKDIATLKLRALPDRTAQNKNTMRK
jgi:hypothetical protein